MGEKRVPPGGRPGPRSVSTRHPRTLWGHETWGHAAAEAEQRGGAAVQGRRDAGRAPCGPSRHRPRGGGEVPGGAGPARPRHGGTPPGRGLRRRADRGHAAAYAAQRAEIGPRGYDDRIFRRKARATPRVHALTAEAEHLLTLRETHRLNDIPVVAYDPAP